MSTETLVQVEQEHREVNAVEVQAIGETVFAALAVEAELAMTHPVEGSEIGKYDFTNSLTRLGDGQTVPDER